VTEEQAEKMIELLVQMLLEQQNTNEWLSRMAN